MGGDGSREKAEAELGLCGGAGLSPGGFCCRLWWICSEVSAHPCCASRGARPGAYHGVHWIHQTLISG